MRPALLTWIPAALAACATSPPPERTDYNDTVEADGGTDVADARADAAADARSDGDGDAGDAEGSADSADGVDDDAIEVIDADVDPSDVVDDLLTDDPGADGVGPPRFRPAAASGATYFVGAHPDDDLLFMSPALLRAVQSGAPVRTIMTTAGDGCRNRLPEDRDVGLQLAYAWMRFGRDDVAWTCGDVRIGALVARECGLDGSAVSLVSLRLPDCAPALTELGDGTRSSLTTVATPPRMVSASDVVDALREEFDAAEPAAIHTLDASDAYGHDNADHIQTARWVFAAAATSPARLHEHRCYNTDREYVNVTPADQDAKWEALDLYCDRSAEGEAICTRASGVAFYEWVRRQWVIARHRARVDEAGPWWLSNGGRCLAARGDDVVLAACDGSALRWRAGGAALIANRPGSPVLAGAAGVLRLSPAGAATAAATLMTNGQVRVGAGSCATATAASAPALAACDGDGDVPATQRWALVLPGVVGASTALSDGDVGARRRSFGVARAAGGSFHACVRAAEGIACGAIGPDGVVRSPAVWSAELADSEGWSSIARDATVRYGDVDGDGVDDVCARGSRGVLCGLGLGDRFAPLGLWSDALSDADDGWFDLDRFASIQLGDLNGDGAADLCARFADGLRCGLSEGTGFGALVSSTPSLFDDGTGWDQPSWGSTLRIGDVDGDGRGDACGRSELGLYCALGEGDGRFGELRLWSQRDDLGDAATWPAQEPYWRSLALVDLNGDGRVDACMRSPRGLVCSLSTGWNFDRLALAGPFADGDGFEAEEHGGSLVWAGTAATRRVCARAAAGALCLVP